MDTLIVYIDDADYAKRQLAPMLNGLEAMHCILVGCPPQLNRHAGQWLSKEARRRWRQEWGESVLAEIARTLGEHGNKVSSRVAHDQLLNVTRQIRGQFATLLQVQRALEAFLEDAHGNNDLLALGLDIPAFHGRARCPNRDQQAVEQHLHQVVG